MDGKQCAKSGAHGEKDDAAEGVSEAVHAALSFELMSK